MTLKIKLLLVGLFLAGYGVTVWHVHTWYDAHELLKATNDRLAKIEDSQGKIITFNQDIAKAKTNAKDPCTNKLVPADIVRLLK